MVSHPYISGPGNVVQMIANLRKNFPVNITSETVKKYGLASNNESSVISALQFIGIIDEKGKRTDSGHAAFSMHDDGEFKQKFSDLIKVAYKDLFETFGDDAWKFSKSKLIGYFRQVDKTSEIIGTRQAGVFLAFAAISGYLNTTESKPASNNPPKKQRVAPKSASQPKATGGHVEPKVVDAPPNLPPSASGIALTVRIEINLPTGGDQQTYDAIFRSIKANLYP